MKRLHQHSHLVMRIQIALWRLVHQPGQITIGIQPILLPILNLFILPILFYFASETAQGGEDTCRLSLEHAKTEHQKKRDRPGIFTPLSRFFTVLIVFFDRQNKKVLSGIVLSTEYGCVIFRQTLKK